jgi:hypothetical protein
MQTETQTQTSSNYVNGTLNILFLEAENLKKRDFNKMDPYCQVEFQGNKYKTEPCAKGGQFPKWEQTLEIPIGGVSLQEKISFLVYDKELIKDNKIGRADITLQQLADMSKSGDVCNLDLETFQLLNKHKPAGVLKIKPCFKGSGWPGCDQSLDQKHGVGQHGDVGFNKHHNVGAVGAVGGIGLGPVHHDRGLEQRFQEIQHQIRGKEHIQGWPHGYEQCVHPQTGEFGVEKGFQQDQGYGLGKDFQQDQGLLQREQEIQHQVKGKEFIQEQGFPKGYERNVQPQKGFVGQQDFEPNDVGFDKVGHRQGLDV